MARCGSALCRDTSEADLYERNARMQITTWGRPFINDYARKEWSEMTSGYYAPRWRMFFESLLAADKDHPFDPDA
jgi:alpha-N-acetylglucosaminidase